MPERSGVAPALSAVCWAQANNTQSAPPLAPSPASEPTLGQMIGGEVIRIGRRQFVVGEVIGEGAYARVWAATGPSQEEVAVKEMKCGQGPGILPDATLQKALFEVEVMRRLTSDYDECGPDASLLCAPQVIDHQYWPMGPSAPQAYLCRVAMTRRKGKSLAHWLEVRQAVPSARRSDMVATYCQSFLEGASVSRALLAQLSPTFEKLNGSIAYHRDVNARNLLVHSPFDNDPEDRASAAGSAPSDASMLEFSIVDFGSATDARAWVGNGEGSWKMENPTGDARYWGPASWLRFLGGAEALQQEPGLMRQYVRRLDVFALGVCALEVMAKLHTAECPSEASLRSIPAGSSRSTEVAIVQSTQRVRAAWSAYWTLAVHSFDRLAEYSRLVCSGDQHGAAQTWRELSACGIPRALCVKLADLCSELRNLAEICQQRRGGGPGASWTQISDLLNVLCHMVFHSSSLEWAELSMRIGPPARRKPVERPGDTEVVAGASGKAVLAGVAASPPLTLSGGSVTIGIRADARAYGGGASVTTSAAGMPEQRAQFNAFGGVLGSSPSGASVNTSAALGVPYDVAHAARGASVTTSAADAGLGHLGLGIRVAGSRGPSVSESAAGMPAGGASLTVIAAGVPGDGLTNCNFRVATLPSGAVARLSGAVPSGTGASISTTAASGHTGTSDIMLGAGSLGTGASVSTSAAGPSDDIRHSAPTPTITRPMHSMHLGGGTHAVGPFSSAIGLAGGLATGGTAHVGAAASAGALREGHHRTSVAGTVHLLAAGLSTGGSSTGTLVPQVPSSGALAESAQEGALGGASISPSVAIEAAGDGVEPSLPGRQQLTRTPPCPPRGPQLVPVRRSTAAAVGTPEALNHTIVSTHSGVRAAARVTAAADTRRAANLPVPHTLEELTSGGSAQGVRASRRISTGNGTRAGIVDSEQSSPLAVHPTPPRLRNNPATVLASEVCLQEVEPAREMSFPEVLGSRATGLEPGDAEAHGSIAAGLERPKDTLPFPGSEDRGHEALRILRQVESEVRTLKRWYTDAIEAMRSPPFPAWGGQTLQDTDGDQHSSPAQRRPGVAGPPLSGGLVPQVRHTAAPDFLGASIVAAQATSLGAR